jgi:hypothetical protein
VRLCQFGIRWGYRCVESRSSRRTLLKDDLRGHLIPVTVGGTYRQVGLFYNLALSELSPPGKPPFRFELDSECDHLSFSQCTSPQ